MNKEDLQKIRDWADQKITTGDEPPWSWFQYMKLREVLDQIIGGFGSVRTESSQPMEQRQENAIRLAVSNVEPSSAQPHQQVVVVRLPT